MSRYAHHHPNHNQVPRTDSAESAGQPGDFRVKLALTVCSAEPVADCGACVFCLDKPKFGGAGTKRQSCVVRRAAPTGVPRVHTPLRVVSTQYLEQLGRYTPHSQTQPEPEPSPNPNPNRDPNPRPNPSPSPTP